MTAYMTRLLSAPVEGKRVLITGGTTGIGRATALLLASEGAKIRTFGRNASDLESLLGEAEQLGLDIKGTTADLAEQGALQEVFADLDEEWGGLDILINNAAVAAGEAAETPLDDIDYIVRANLTAYLACAAEAVRRMPGGGTIINVGSMSAETREDGSSVYVATKAGIRGFSAAFRKEVNDKGIRVCLIEPGSVATDMQGKSREEMAELVEEDEMLTPEDIAEAVYFCLHQPERCDVVLLQVRPRMQPI